MKFQNKKSSEILIQWHNSLDENRGIRAGLRRVKSLEEVYLTDGFREILIRLKPFFKEDSDYWFTSLAIVAGLAAHVSSNDTKLPFAAQLGHSSDSPALSEIRFQRLLAVSTPEELFRELRRSIKLAGGSINLTSLAEDVFQWCRENWFRQNGYERDSERESIRVRWTLEYYNACIQENSN